jgi:hypothetical protein
LDSPEEKPEQRSGFVHPELTKWVRNNRASLLTDALTVLSAFCRAGRPDQRLVPFGSFEGWSSLIRGAIVWCGLADPYETRVRLDALTEATNPFPQFMDAIKQFDPKGVGFTASGLINDLYVIGSPPHESLKYDVLKSALEAFVGTPPGKFPSPASLGNKLRAVRRQVRNKMCFDIDASRKDKAGAVWRLFTESSK